MTRFTAIHRLLGVPPGTESPFDLLGLSPTESIDERAVESALRRQLQRLEGHPQATGHEAEEARLALHSAAAQILDPTVRSHLVRRSQFSTLSPEPIGDRAAAPGRSGATPHTSNPAFHRDALRTLVLGRGLNRRTRGALIGLARIHGLDGDAIVHELKALSAAGPSLSSRRPSPRSDVEFATAQRTIYEDIQRDADYAESRMRRRLQSVWIGAATLAIVFLSGAAIIWAIWSSSGPDVGRSVAESGAAVADEGLIDSEPGRAPDADEARPRSAALLEEKAEPAAPGRLSAEVLLTHLRDVVDMYVRSPGDAAWRFEDAAERLQSWWTTYDQAALIAMNSKAVELAHLMTPESRSSERILSALAAGLAPLQDSDAVIGASDVWPAVWSAGVLTRLAVDRQLPTSSLRRIDSELTGALSQRRRSGEAAFHGGALDAVEALRRRLPISETEAGPPQKAWERWLTALDRVTIERAGDDPERLAAREGMILAACERIFSEGPSPAIDPAAREVLVALLEAPEWPSGESGAAPTASQLRLLRWFSDPAIQSGDLAVVVEWLGEGAGPAIGQREFSLPRNASAQRRAEARARLAEIWGLTHLTADEGLAITWASAARDAISNESIGASLAGDFAEAVLLARLCEAAALRWGYEESGAMQAMEQAEESRQRVMDAAREAAAAVGRDVRSDGFWAERYLGLARGDVEGRLNALGRMERMNDRLGPVDAEVLAEAAMFPEPAPVKSAAQRQVVRRRDEFWMVKGVLDALVRAPRSHENMRLVENITGATLSRDLGREWSDAARRLALEKLLRMLSQRRTAAAGDAAASELADCYTARRAALLERTGAGDGDSASDVETRGDPLRAAERLREHWRREAGRFAGLQQGWRSPSALDRRHAGRMEIAEGVVQRFAAAQVGVAEALASVVASERPSRRPAIEELMSRLGGERRRAETVAGQIRATERVLLGLWMVRFGVEMPSEEETS